VTAPVHTCPPDHTGRMTTGVASLAWGPPRPRPPRLAADPEAHQPHPTLGPTAGTTSRRPASAPDQRSNVGRGPAYNVCGEAHSAAAARWSLLPLLRRPGVLFRHQAGNRHVTLREPLLLQLARNVLRVSGVLHLPDGHDAQAIGQPLLLLRRRVFKGSLDNEVSDLVVHQ